MNQIKVLVTGATGFIGSTLVRKLAASDGRYEVLTLIRKSSNPRNLEDPGVGAPSYRRVEGDLCDPRSLASALDGVDIVFNLAGAVVARDRGEFFKHNAEGTANLARAVSEAQKAGRCKITRFVHVSSLAAAGPSPHIKERVETDIETPISAYGESKRAGEWELKPYFSEFPVTIIRPPLVYGPRDRGVFSVIRTVAKGLMPVVTGGGKEGARYYSVVHVDDLCQLLWLTIQPPGLGLASGEIFFACEDRVYTYRQLLEAMRDALGKKAVAFPVPSPLVRLIGEAFQWAGQLSGRALPLNRDKVSEILANYWICSNKKAKQQLGFAPQWDLKHGMEQTIKWYRERKWLP